MLSFPVQFFRLKDAYENDLSVLIEMSMERYWFIASYCSEFPASEAFPEVYQR